MRGTSIETAFNRHCGWWLARFGRFSYLYVASVGLYLPNTVNDKVRLPNTVINSLTHISASSSLEHFGWAYRCFRFRWRPPAHCQWIHSACSARQRRQMDGLLGGYCCWPSWWAPCGRSLSRACALGASQRERETTFAAANQIERKLIWLEKWTKIFIRENL